MSTIQVARYDGTQIQVSVYPPIENLFAVLTASEYIDGQPVSISLAGIDTGAPYSLYWSPTIDRFQIGTATLTVFDSNLDIDGNGTVQVIATRGVVRYNTSGYIHLVQGANTSYLTKNLTPEAGKQTVILTSPLSTFDTRITAIPDLAAGDQLVWWNVLPSGNVLVNSDASFEADEVVQAFTVEAHAEGFGYGESAIQYLAEAPIITEITDDNQNVFFVGQTGVRILGTNFGI